MVIGKCAETTTSGDTHLAYVIRVVSGDGGTIRGVIGLYHATSTEFALVASAATRIHSARTDGATAFSSQVGDRIIVEIGLHGVTPALEAIQMRKGDPVASPPLDFALTAGLTTDLVPWVQLSRDVVFGFADSNTEAGTATEASDATQIKPAAVSEVGTAAETSDGMRITTSAIAETVSATDESNAARPALSADITEAISALDTISAILAIISDLSEAGSATDSSSATQERASGIAEDGSAIDAQNGLRVTDDVITETAVAIETQTGLLIYAATITEAGSAGDTPSNFAIIFAGINEDGYAVDASDAPMGAVLTAGITETISAIDVSSKLFIGAAEIEEMAIAITEQDVFYPKSEVAGILMEVWSAPWRKVI
jgi:hypothetical protein